MALKYLVKLESIEPPNQQKRGRAREPLKVRGARKVVGRGKGALPLKLKEAKYATERSFLQWLLFLTGLQEAKGIRKGIAAFVVYTFE